MVRDTKRLGLVAQRNKMPFVFDAARKIGIELVSIEGPEDPPLAGLTSVSSTVATDIFGTPERAREDVQRLVSDGEIDGLFTLRDEAVPWVADTTAALGLPGITARAARLTRDKHAMRDAFAAKGCRVPLYQKLTDGGDAELTDAVRRLSFPLVVKPTSGFASTGVSLVRTLEELREAVDLVRSINDTKLAKVDASSGTKVSGIILEQFIDGPEHTAEIFCRDGKVTVLTVGHKGNPKGPWFEEDIYRTPAPLTDELIEAISEQAALGVAALGIDFGPAHCELRLKDGREPFVLEIGARVGGSGSCHFLVETATGVNYLGEQMKACAGLSTDLDFSRRYVRHVRQYAGQYIIPLGGHGRYLGLEGADTVKAHPETAYFVEILKPGSDVARMPNFAGFPGFIMSAHNSYEAAVAYHQWLDHTISTTFEDAVPESTANLANR